MAMRSFGAKIRGVTACYRVVKTLLVLICGLAASLSYSYAEVRSLKLFYIHTNERAEIVFWRDGHYDREGLKKLNVFLRDWRRNEPTNMDPRLFTLIWSVYQASGSRSYIHVVSAYRSPATNSLLRLRSPTSGVAKNSQHTLGQAMDFYLPDVPLAKLRAIALKQQVGGVGYYPTSGSPFVHLDVGGVRHWPRMSRKELTALFPDGKTLYIPSDGKPLPGFAQAAAEYRQRGGAPTLLAQKAPAPKRSWFASLLPTERSRTPSTQATSSKDSEKDQPMTSLYVSNQSGALRTADAIPIPTLLNRPVPQTNDGDAPNDKPVTEIPRPEFKAIASSDRVSGQWLSFVDDTDASQEREPIPIPRIRPRNDVNADTVELADSFDDQSNEMSRSTISQDNVVTVAGLISEPESDPVKSLISESSDVIPVPDDGDTAEDDDANLGIRAHADQSESVKRLNALIGTTDHDQQTVASVAADEGSAEQSGYAQRVSKADVDKTQSNKSTTKQTSVDMTDAEEIQRLPRLVFTSGLVKRRPSGDAGLLTGKAIDFLDVARLY